MNVERFTELVGRVARAVGERPLDGELERDLNARFGPDSDAFADLAAACRTGVAEGWLCGREAGGIKFGRVVKPNDDMAGMSVDVVEMTDVVGPHHAHPNGEIDLIIPQDDAAEFDGRGAGWLVYGPGTAHSPTVTGGRAIVLYLLPGGEIEFT